MFLTNGEVMKKQDKIDWNFHINFSPLYFVFAVMVLMAISFNAEAEEIEEVVVVAQQIETAKADPLKESSFIRVLLPAHTWTAGGYGAFQGYNERGAQTVHTRVFKNGIPANLPGSAWYDFGNEMATGQDIKVISGANSVVYGSGSIAGTILIKDVIQKGMSKLYWENKPDGLRLRPICYKEHDVYRVWNDEGDFCHCDTMWLFGAHAYILTPKGANKLVKDIPNGILPADVFIGQDRVDIHDYLPHSVQQLSNKSFIQRLGNLTNGYNSSSYVWDY